MTIISRHILFIVFALVALAISAGPRSTHDGEPLPSFVVLIEDEVVDSARFDLPDSTFYRIAASTIFPVNKYRLNMSDTLIRDLDRHILPQLRESGMQLTAVTMRGAASPEGPFDFNTFLSHKRLQALMTFLTERIPADPDRLVITHTEAEDYTYLKLLMREAADPQTAVVDSLIEAGAGRPAAIKRNLQRYQGGKLWNRLWRTYYPKLRAARMVLFFTPAEPPAPEVEILVPEVPLLEVGTIDVEPNTIAPDLRREERRHALAITSNLLYDAFYMPNYGWAPMPNIGVEFFPRGGRFTFAASFTCPYYHRWNRNQFFQIRDYHLEVRRYFDPTFHHAGFYVGAYANVNKFGIGLSKQKGWQGEGIGGALKGGYVVYVGGRWRVDFSVAFGAYVTKYDPYVYGNPVTGEVNGDYYYDYLGSPSLFKRRNHRFAWFGPTEVGITVTYDILFWRQAKGGVSALRFE